MKHRKRGNHLAASVRRSGRCGHAAKNSVCKTRDREAGMRACFLKFYFAACDAFACGRKVVAPALLFLACVIDPIFQSDNYQLSRKLLDAAALRHEAIATNIANAETPGFRRLDVAPDFAVQLKARLAAGDLATSSTPLRPTLAEDPTARSVRPDGNTVEIERELIAMNRNAVEHEYLTQVVSNSLKQLKLAITGRSVG
jgi:flagellar basal-body rod protein FlgB